MTKEEQIREIIIEIHPCYIYQDDPSPREIAKQIYESGYRKADEVRKETAQEICRWLRSWLKWDEEGVVMEIAEKYGVEAEE